MMWFVDINDGTTNSTKATLGLPEVRGIPFPFKPIPAS